MGKVDIVERVQEAVEARSKGKTIEYKEGIDPDSPFGRYIGDIKEDIDEEIDAYKVFDSSWLDSREYNEKTGMLAIYFQLKPTNGKTPIILGVVGSPVPKTFVRDFDNADSPGRFYLEYIAQYRWVRVGSESVYMENPTKQFEAIEIIDIIDDYERVKELSEKVPDLLEGPSDDLVKAYKSVKKIYDNTRDQLIQAKSGKDTIRYFRNFAKDKRTAKLDMNRVMNLERINKQIRAKVGDKAKNRYNKFKYRNFTGEELEKYQKSVKKGVREMIGSTMRMGAAMIVPGRGNNRRARRDFASAANKASGSGRKTGLNRAQKAMQVALRTKRKYDSLKRGYDSIKAINKLFDVNYSWVDIIVDGVILEETTKFEKTLRERSRKIKYRTNRALRQFETKEMTKRRKAQEKAERDAKDAEKIRERWGKL